MKPQLSEVFRNSSFFYVFVCCFIKHQPSFQLCPSLYLIHVRIVQSWSEKIEQSIPPISIYRHILSSDSSIEVPRAIRPPLTAQDIGVYLKKQVSWLVLFLLPESK